MDLAAAVVVEPAGVTGPLAAQRKTSLFGSVCVPPDGKQAGPMFSRGPEGVGAQREGTLCQNAMPAWHYKGLGTDMHTPLTLTWSWILSWTKSEWKEGLPAMQTYPYSITYISKSPV